MKSEITLEEGIYKIYGNNFQRVIDISSSWYLFSPYRHKTSQQTFYFKVLEVPTGYHISQQIYHNNCIKYKGLLHEIQIFFIQRCFQSTFYLLRSSNNIISLKGLLQLRSDCGQIVEAVLLCRLVEFIAHLKGKNIHNHLKIDINNIGLTQQGTYRLCDYSLYFFKRPAEISNLSDVLMNLFSRIITLNKNELLNREQLYELALQTYSISFANFVLQVLKPDCFEKDKILELVALQMENLLDRNTTITQSFISIDLKSDIEVNHGSFAGNSFLAVKNDNSKEQQSIIINIPVKKTSKAKKFIIFAGIFAALCAIAMIVLFGFHLIHTPIKCGEGEYVSSDDKCLSCAVGCQRCVDGGDDQCLSCKGLMYLVVKSEQDKTGICMKQCKGKYIGKNTCVWNP